MAQDRQVVWITGATGPAGRAAARAFAADGARLGLFGTDEGRLHSVAGDLGLAEGDWTAGIGDLGDGAAARAATEAVRAVVGPPDILLHLVGGYAGGTPLAEVDPQTLQSMLASHVWSTFHLVGAVTPSMVERGWGRVVAITSVTAAAPTGGDGSYAAAKAAQTALLRSLARDVASSGVTVNLLAVRAIDDGSVRDREPSRKKASWTTPEDLVGVMRFLCTDAAAAINGQVLRLDGR